MGTSDHRFQRFIGDVIDPFLSVSLTDFQKTIDLDENDRTLIEKLKRKIENLKCLIDDDARPAKIPRITKLCIVLLSLIKEVICRITLWQVKLIYYIPSGR